MRYHFFILLILISILLCSCVSNKPFYNKSAQNWDDSKPDDTAKILHTVILAGDGRQAYLEPTLLNFLKIKMNEAGINSTTIFLGDNVQPYGLPDSFHRNWKIAEKSILVQLNAVKNYKGRLIFIPGNHDWAFSGIDGLKFVKNQRKFIENYLNKEEVFLPKKGRPGPVEVHLTEDIVLIIFDSQWWLHEHDKSYSGIEDEVDFFIQLRDAIIRNKDKKIIVTTHHPLWSVGKHGGHFPAKLNLFPLLDLNKNLYIPLPGFIYIIYRKYFGNIQDISHPQYKSLKDELLDIFEECPDLIFAAGHDHNLQYVNKNSLHHIISGSISMAMYIAKTKKTDFAYKEKGFCILDFYNNGDVWMEFWVLDKSQYDNGNAPEGKVVFRKKLFSKTVYNKTEQDKVQSEADFSDSTVTVYPIGEHFQAGKIKRIFFGNNYRKEWETPVEVPVFDFNQKGGLKIVKIGGNAQTTSIRLENEKGQQWVLRSLEKDPLKAIPEILRFEGAIRVVEDQISASLPYAALTLPRMADAIGIYHTNPEVVYLARDPHLGKYIDQLSDAMYLFEERPAGNRDDIASFGYSKKIIGSADLFEVIFNDPNHKVDQVLLLKSRLFDILINDWDRHEDQWRWASFPDSNKTIYRPIPRDRDQTFFVNEGVFPWMSKQKNAVRINQDFDHEVTDMGGLNYNARFLDRNFLNELPMDIWLTTAQKMKEQLTDKIIEDAVNDMPEEIVAINGDVIISKLKTRRDKLVGFAETQYLLLAEKVDIVGTNQREYFLVERLNDEKTRITVFALNNQGKKEDVFYQRIFNYSETKEIRLYGLKGKDKFKIKGTVNQGIKIRIIGGKSKDKMTDESHVSGLSKKTLIYDSKHNNELLLGREGKDLTSDKEMYNEYDRRAFKYNKFIMPMQVGYNVDDGIFVGFGLLYTTHGYKKYPFATWHKVRTNFSNATKAYYLKYNGIFTSAIFDLDLIANLEYRAPTYSQNFFGMGNKTKLADSTADYSRVRIAQVNVNPEIRKSFKTYNVFKLGAFYRSYSVERTPGRFISDLKLNDLDSTVFDRMNYLGFNLGYTLDTRNSDILPSRGILWKTEANYYYGFKNSLPDFSKLTSDMRFYLSFRNRTRTVLAIRFGGSINTGKYEFFQASTLGGKYNLRGYKQTRFAADACFYQNTDLRIRLFHFTNYFGKGQVGILGFNDVGKVWLEGEDSKKWHHGYGGGIWIAPFNLVVLSATINLSQEDQIFSAGYKFLF